MLTTDTTKYKASVLQQLETLKEAGIIRSLDFQFARFLYQLQPSPLLALAGALVSFEVGQGHTCIDLRTLYSSDNGSDRSYKTCFNLSTADQQQLINSINIPEKQWGQHLSNLSPVGNGSTPAPLVYDQERLYLHRYWYYETIVVHWLQKQYVTIPDGGNNHKNNNHKKNIINRLFPEKDEDTNWQKIAATLASCTSFTVISGGPGTGKTTTVTRLMALLLELSAKQQYPLMIELAAPTGKAAARLSESIQRASESLNSPPSIKRLIPRKAGTVHRLLGARPGKTSYRYNANNHLHLDVLVVDEASMIDLTLMARLLVALPPHAKLILLGDRNQLASVEAGSVLGDICAFADLSYTKELSRYLQNITGEKIDNPWPPIRKNTQLPATPVNNHLCLLRKSFRFKENSGIGQLANAINQGDIPAITRLWEKPLSDICLHETSSQGMQHLLSLTIQGYASYLQAVADKKSAREIHAIFNEFQLLCALREGERGVSGLNATVEQALKHASLLPSTDQLWYPGRPVMITHNDHTLELYNGDIGITLKDTDGKLRVAFIMPDNTIKMLLPNRLPEHQSVFAMTIHKSQGSEFSHTVVVLPEQPSPQLTRELLYTGITRAKKRLDIFGDARLIQYAIRQKTQRTSGISERLISTH